MDRFAARNQHLTGCVLSCFDREVIPGTSQDIYHAKAMAGYLGARGIRLLDDARSAEPLRDEVRTKLGGRRNPRRIRANGGAPDSRLGARALSGPWNRENRA